MKESLFIGKSGRKMGLMMHKPNKKDLQYLAELCGAGKVVPVIDKSFPLIKIVEAFKYYGEDLAQGKVVITI